MNTVAINSSAPVTHRGAIRINAPADTVWQALTDINRWATWQKDVAYARLNGELAPGATFTWKAGDVKIVSTLHTVAPKQAIGWISRSLGVYAIHNWTLEEEEGQTSVRVEESMEGFFVALLRRRFRKSLQKGMRASLEQLKREAERGSTAMQSVY